MNTIHKRHPVAINRDGMAQIGPTVFQLRGIQFFNDEGGAPGGNPPAETPPAPPAPVPTPPPAPQPPAPQPPAEQPPVNYRGNPDEYVRELRDEAKNHRLAAEKATNDLTATQAERDQIAAERDNLARERALLLAAPKYGARADLLLDSSSFMKTFADIDLADDAAVEKAITDALERNSAFKAGPNLPGTSGGGHQGGGHTTPKPTLQGAVAARMQG